MDLVEIWQYFYEVAACQILPSDQQSKLHEEIWTRTVTLPHLPAMLYRESIVKFSPRICIDLTGVPADRVWVVPTPGPLASAAPKSVSLCWYRGAAETNSSQ